MNPVKTILIVAVIVLVISFGLVVFFGAPYVPSQRKYVYRAFKHFGINEKDYVVDVGSGDGVILRIASRFKARAIGYEINPILVLISRWLSLPDEHITTKLKNGWTAEFPDETTFVYAFAVERDQKKLQALVQREANRLRRPLKLLCLGSPFRNMKATETFEAYHLYIFHPLQSKNA